jgi:AmpD protein
MNANNNAFKIKKGCLVAVEQQKSPHFEARPIAIVVDLLVIHNISLPAGCFNTPYISDLFLGRLDCTAHPSFNDLRNLRVSAHCLIKRTGQVIQYVNFNDKAWHAGVSQFQARENCNDFSIGIELEGCDNVPYTLSQYQQLIALTRAIQKTYPAITPQRIVGHCDIAPQRKTDPGQSFDWQYFRQCLQ